jgi:hypothetical protein
LENNQAAAAEVETHLKGINIIKRLGETKGEF